MFLLKKTFFKEKNINENVKNMYLIWKMCFYTENACVKSKIYIFLNSFMMGAVITLKPVHWFAEQINGLVSKW